MVSRYEGTKDKDKMVTKVKERVKNSVYTPSMERKYASMEEINCFWVLILILLQIYVAIRNTPSMVKMAMIGKNHMLEGDCYCFLFLIVCLMGTKPNKKRRRYRKKAEARGFEPPRISYEDGK
jgi:hypothetical protein